MIDGVPTLSTWLFYAGNVLLIAAYLVICALMLRRGGLTGRGQLSPTLTTITVLFFLSCALLHLELAFHAYSKAPLVARDGTGGGVDLHFSALILAKVVLVVLFAVATTRRAGSSDEVVPFSPTRTEMREAREASEAGEAQRHTATREHQAGPT